MANSRTKQQKKRPTAMNLWRCVLAIIGIVAVVQELRKPPQKRTWHGRVADLVPYDFRKPTMDRVRETYWNPEGPVISGKIWGVGWAPNFGAVKKLFAA